MFATATRILLKFGLLLLLWNLLPTAAMATLEQSASFEKYTYNLEVQPDSIFVMSGFSPNGDGENDTFTIVGAEHLENSKLVIFNMYGAELFSSEAYKNDWDGSSATEPLKPEEIYLYVFEDGNGHTYSGQFRVNL